MADRVADSGVAGEFQTSNSEGGWKFEAMRLGDSNFEVRGYLKIVARLEIRSLRRGFPSTRLPLRRRRLPLARLAGRYVGPLRSAIKSGDGAIRYDFDSREGYKSRPTGSPARALQVEIGRG